MRFHSKLKRFSALRQAYAAGRSARLNEQQRTASPSPSGRGQGEGETIQIPTHHAAQNLKPETLQPAT
jgi:hypothetical protein